jgi:hypothetical protein
MFDVRLFAIEVIQIKQIMISVIRFPPFEFHYPNNNLDFNT